MTMIYTGTSISFHANGQFHQAHSSHPSFQRIVELCKEGNFGNAAALVDIKKVVVDSLKGTKAELRNDNVYYEGQLVNSLLARRIISMVKQGFNATPLLLFLENLMDNPSKRAVDELYGFLEASQLPITEDGHFLAYKSIRDNYTDHHTGTMDNSVGTIVQMPRNQVDEDKDRTCSYGLHFAAHEYAKGFGGGRMVVLKINPADVVAIPSDYNNQKGRACKYLILEEVERSDSKLTGASFVNTGKGKDTTVTFGKPKYVPQADNYDDRELWKSSVGLLVFQGKAEEFPVNRDAPYILERKSDRKEYRGEFYFRAYDEKNGNLIFARRGADGEWERYVTISDVTDWYIQHDVETLDN